MRRALLVLHSPQDNTVGIDNAGILFKTARHPKSFVTLDGADHLLSREADAAYVGQVIATHVIAGPLDDEQKARLLEFADRCPVHRTSHGEVIVHTTLGADDNLP